MSDDASTGRLQLCLLKQTVSQCLLPLISVEWEHADLLLRQHLRLDLAALALCFEGLTLRSSLQPLLLFAFVARWILDLVNVIVRQFHCRKFSDFSSAQIKRHSFWRLFIIRGTDKRILQSQICRLDRKHNLAAIVFFESADAIFRFVEPNEIRYFLPLFDNYFMHGWFWILLRKFLVV